MVALAVIVGVNFDPRVGEVQQKAFDSHPLGIPRNVFLGLLSALLFLPAFLINRHLVRLLSQARADREAILGKFGFAMYLLRVGRLHPGLRRTQAVVALGILYLVIVAMAWAVFARYRGCDLR